MKQKLLSSLTTLGSYMQQHANGTKLKDLALQELNEKHFDNIEGLIQTEHSLNAWFTEKNIRQAIGELGCMLTAEKLEAWIDRYKKLPVQEKKAKKIGVIMAGNIPLVGFHDFISVLISGHCFVGKASSKDERLIKALGEVLLSIDSHLKDKIAFTEGNLKDVDAIIATGSNNSAKHFEYYFKAYPNIIRKNRNGVAVLTGMETESQLLALGKDIFSYFGLGCRNVTKVYIPEGTKMEWLLRAFEAFTEEFSEHHKYMNNIAYHRTMYLMNKVQFLDNGILLVKEDENIASPVGVVYYEKYTELNELIKIIDQRSKEIQCIVSLSEEIKGRVAPGKTQSPSLWDYADGIDTLSFLMNL